MIAPGRAQCSAAAASNGGRQCRNPATDAGTAAAGGIPCCDYVSHQRQLRERPAVESLSDRPPIGAAPAGSGVDSTRQAERIDAAAAAAGVVSPVDPERIREVSALLEALPPEPDDIAPRLAASSTGPAAAASSADELEERAARLLDAGGRIFGGELPEEPAEADAAAREEAERASTPPPPRGVPGAAAGLEPGGWTPERVRFYLEELINPRFRRDGKAELTDAELEEGSIIGAAVLSDIFGPRSIENPYGALAAWAAVVVGVRYFEELIVPILSWVAGLVRRRVRFPGLAASNGAQRAAAPASAPPPPTARHAPPADELFDPWGSI